MSDWLSNVWANLSSTQAPPAPWMLIVSLLIALVLTYSPAWALARNLITVVHEGGHAMTAVLWGRRVGGIKLHSDTSGVTFSSGKAYGLGAIFTTAAGYTAPALLGLAVTWLVVAGRAYLSIVILGLLMALMFLSIRNLWGLIITVPLTLGFYYSLQFVETFQVFIVTAVAVFLTVASLRPIIELQIARARGEAQDSDADQLQKLTFLIPGLIWVLLFFAVSLAANVLALLMLLESFLVGLNM